jgi:hypothetical protein
MKGALLDPHAADRLRKLCGMLGSAHDGERAAAGLKADQLVRQLGLTWQDVIVAPPIAPDPPRIRSWRAGESDWQRMARFCHARQGQLSLRDRDFIRSMIAWRGAPSAKQQSWLIDLFVQCGGSR